MKRREFIGLLGAAPLFAASPLMAQIPGRPRRLGLMANSALRPVERFRNKLRDLGYVEGQNLLIEARFSEGRDDRHPAFAAELAALPVDLIVVWGTPAALAAKRATTTIPIVVGAAGEVVGTGIVSNLARPEGNITGFVALNVDLEEKRIELLKEMMPQLSRLAILLNSLNPLNRVNYEVAQRAAARLSLAIEKFEVRGAPELDQALTALTRARPDAVLIGADILLLGERRRIVETLTANRIPAIYPFREYSEVGGFISYGADIADLFERAAGYVDRILKGEKPGDLPVQQATAFEIIINLKAAAALGLTLSPGVLVRANEVIE